MADANLKLGNVIEVPSADVAPGFITTTNPDALSPVPAGFAIDIFISTGPGTYLLGADYAERVLSSVLFELEDQAGMSTTVIAEFHPDIDEGLVVRTEPAGPTELEVGSEITVYISDGPEPIDVPSVVGLTEAEATALLSPLGLSIEVIGTTQEGVPGQITAQSPTTGTQLAPGEVITVIVAVEPDSAFVTLGITIVNDNGGTATASDFSITLDGNTVSWNTPLQVDIGTHLASAGGLTGYTVSSWSGDCSVGGSVTVIANDSAVCTIVMDDIPPVTTTTTIPPTTTTTIAP